MKRLLLGILFTATLCFGQFGPNWSSATPPENGACFYEDPEFKGEYFCLDVDSGWTELNKTFDHKISSVRVIGKANARVFSRANFQGDSALINDRTPNLKQVVVDGVKWNDHIASVQVVAAPDRVVQRRHVRPANGACIYTEREYEGHEMCLDGSTRIAKLPDDFYKKIESLRTYGDVDMVLYSKPDFQGASTTVSTRVRDMRQLTRDTQNFFDWNKRVASLEIRLRPTGQTASTAPPATTSASPNPPRQ
jgi:hypothetical protein